MLKARSSSALRLAGKWLEDFGWEGAGVKYWGQAWKAGFGGLIVLGRKKTNKKTNMCLVAEVKGAAPPSAERLEAHTWCRISGSIPIMFRFWESARAGETIPHLNLDPWIIMGLFTSTDNLVNPCGSFYTNMISKKNCFNEFLKVRFYSIYDLSGIWNRVAVGTETFFNL